MNEIIKKSEELKTSLLELEEVKEYLRLKQLYLSNEEIRSLEILLERTPKEDKQYKLIKKEYDNHPLVINYLKAKEEVDKILFMIKEILEK